MFPLFLQATERQESIDHLPKGDTLKEPLLLIDSMLLDHFVVRMYVPKNNHQHTAFFFLDTHLISSTFISLEDSKSMDSPFLFPEEVSLLLDRDVIGLNEKLFSSSSNSKGRYTRRRKFFREPGMKCYEFRIREKTKVYLLSADRSVIFNDDTFICNKLALNEVNGRMRFWALAPIP